MLDLKFIRQNPDQIRTAIQQKGIPLNLDDLLGTDQKLLGLKRALQLLDEQKNANAKRVPTVSASEKAELIALGKKISAEIETLKPKIVEAETRLQEYLWLVPNIPSPDAPIGKTDEDNVEIKRWGEQTRFDFNPTDHIQLLQKHDWAEFERLAKVAGTRSYSLKSDMVLLEFALIRFAMDKLKAKGFTLITVPSLAREFAFYGTGHFPTGKDQAYRLPEDDLFLAGTAEVVVNGIHSGDNLKEADLPILYAAFSPCFRREAGASGKDTRGLIRVHQFMKVEQYVLCKNDPKESLHWHNTLLRISEEMLEALELPYRVVDVCTGDMGAGKIRQYDLEAWVPSEKKYRETHSCSSLHEWQARRTNLRYRDHAGAMQYCHTLNNTAIATPRILVPLLENHQQKDGTIAVPLALRPYLNGMTTLGTTESEAEK